MRQITLISAFILLMINPLLANIINKNKFDLAIKNVDIFDSKNKTIQKNKTILVKDKKIASIINSSQKFLAKQTIKGTGKLIIPGFIDTHTHILQTYGSKNFKRKYVLEDEVLESYKKLIARQFLANGITTIIDMAQPEPWIETSLKLQKNPSPNFPNLFINGSSTVSDLSWDRTPPLHHEKIFSAKDGRKKVQKYARLGIRHMKLYWKLEEADMKAVVDEAKKHGITLNAHVDNNIVTIPQAMNLGVRNFEHFFTLTPSILNIRDTYPKFNKKFGFPDGRINIDAFAANMVLYFKYIDENPALKTKMMELIEQMATNKTSISTALNVLATAAKKSNSFSTFASLPPRNTPMTNYNTEQQKQLDDAFSTMMRYMKIAHDKGVKLRIGTDTRYGGKAFLSELMLFSKAGFPVEDILQIATINGAEAMNIDDKFGSIEVGKNADLVIFDQNPFENYKNFQSEKTIIKDGKIFKLKTSVAYSLLDEINKKGIKSANKWFQKHKKSGKYGEVDEAELNEISFQLISDGKITEAIVVNKLIDGISNENSKVYNGLTEDTINNVGYNYLQKNDYKTAIELFTFNVYRHPKSANAYDSLGEAYHNDKNKKYALINYKKSIELNPRNYNAKYIVNELEGKEVKVESKLLDRYAGKYEFRQNVIWNIVREGKKITFQEMGGNKLTLEAISDNRFVIPRSTTSITFEKDSAEKIIGMVLNQGGELLKAKKIN